MSQLDNVVGYFIDTCLPSDDVSLCVQGPPLFLLTVSDVKISRWSVIVGWIARSSGIHPCIVTSTPGCSSSAPLGFSVYPAPPL